MKYFLSYCIFVLIVTQLTHAKYTDNCPKRCHRCRTGNWKETLCTYYCSNSRWCGTTKHYRRGAYTDCTSCNAKYYLNTYKNITKMSLNSDDQKQSKLKSSQELSKKHSQPEQSSNPLLKYFVPIFISFVIVILIIVVVWKYTAFGKKLSCLSPFPYSNLL